MSTAVMVAPAPVAMIPPMATAVVDHRRGRIVTRRCIDHRRGRPSPTKRADIYVEVYAGIGGRAYRQRKRDNAN